MRPLVRCAVPFLLIVVASAVYPVAAPAQANLAGQWNVEWQGGPDEMSMQLTQKDTKVKGFVIFRSGDFPIKGTVDGNHFILDWTMPGGVEDEKIRFEGTVDGDTMTGVARLSDEDFDRDLYAQRVGP
jgi:hypothetical protein